MNWRPVLESWYSRAGLEEGVACRPRRARRGCACPSRGASVNGLGMKVAQMPWLSATSLIDGAEGHDVVGGACSASA